MFNVIECVAHQHDWRLVLLAAAICVQGSIALFILLKRASECVEARRRQWLAVAAVAEGTGVWATHFVSMLAYDGGVPLSFDVMLTVLSVTLAVGFFWLALHVLGRLPNARRSALAALVAAIGVAVMHFIGMASIEAPVFIRYAMTPITLGFLFAWACFFGAFQGFARLRGRTRLWLATGMTVLAIVVLHFGTMAATTLVPNPGIAVLHGESRVWLIPAIVVAVLALIALILTSSFLDRMLTDLRGLTDATLEGLMIVHGGMIIEVNQQLCALLGRASADLIGTRAEDWFNLLTVPLPESGKLWTVEAVIAGATDPDQVVEVSTHEIEYRGRFCEVLAVRDLTERKRAERAVEYMAAHDALTDLPNRAAFDRALEEACQGSRHNDGFVLLALDLDRFKAVNDIFGHHAGDEILKRVATMLSSVVRGDDVVARIGGDEFLILQRNSQDDDAAQTLAIRILETFGREMDIARDPMAVGVSIGVALYPRDGADSETLRQNADLALYRAKEEGRGLACFFDPDMNEQARERRALEHDLRHALSRNELHLAFQPLVSTAFSATVGYEALLRWTHPTRGDVTPDTFVPIAEDIGAILPIGEWVLREACRVAAGWTDDLSIAVNISAVQFQVGDLAALVRSATEDAGLNPRRLELEITESVLLKNRESTLTALHAIKAMGVRIVMDDFGTGYSSLSNLQSFPFDKIKIDRSFVSMLTEDDAARSIIRAIVSLGKSLNLPVVAEGVETDAQRLMVLEEGCPQAQGFLFGRPFALTTGGRLRDRPAMAPLPVGGLGA